MTYLVFNASGTRLHTTTSYLAARRCWGAYLSTSPAPSVDAGIFTNDLDRLDTDALDRWTGYGSSEEREPTAAELLDATACT